jgi:hypothetical protein
MNHIGRMAVVCVALLIATPAHSLTGAELYEGCSQRQEQMKSMLCDAYISGFIDGVVNGHFAEAYGNKLCNVEEGIEVTQGRLIIEKYMQDNPQYLHMQARFVAGRALQSAFGCK